MDLSCSLGLRPRHEPRLPAAKKASAASPQTEIVIPKNTSVWVEKFFSFLGEEDLANCSVNRLWHAERIRQTPKRGHAFVIRLNEKYKRYCRSHDLIPFSDILGLIAILFPTHDPRNAAQLKVMVAAFKVQVTLTVVKLHGEFVKTKSLALKPPTFFPEYAKQISVYHEAFETRKFEVLAELVEKLDPDHKLFIDWYHIIFDALIEMNALDRAVAIANKSKQPSLALFTLVSQIYKQSPSKHEAAKKIINNMPKDGYQIWALLLLVDYYIKSSRPEKGKTLILKIIADEKNKAFLMQYSDKEFLNGIFKSLKIR